MLNTIAVSSGRYFAIHRLESRAVDLYVYSFHKLEKQLYTEENWEDCVQSDDLIDAAITKVQSRISQGSNP